MSLSNLGTLLSGFLILIIGLRVYQLDKEHRLGRSFLLLAALYSWMSITWYQLGQTYDLETATFLRKLQSVWAIAIPLLTINFYHFGRSYGIKIPPFFKSFYVVFLFLPGLFFLYLEWFSNFQHGNLVWVESGEYWGLDLPPLDIVSSLRGCWMFLNFSLCVIFTFGAYQKSIIPREKNWLFIIFIAQLCSYSLSLYQNYLSPFQGIILPVNESLNCLVATFLFGWAFSDFKLFEINQESAIENIVSSMTNWLVLTDEQFQIKSVNPTVEEAFKNTDFTLSQSSFSEMVLIHNDSSEIEALEKLKNKTDRYQKEWVFELTGTKRTIAMNVTPILDHWKSRVGFAFIGHDVTDYKAAKTQIQNFASDLQQSNEALAHFAHIASHDLKEPLRTINSFTGLIEKKLDDKFDDQTREYFQFVKDGAKRMNDMISGILEFSKIRNAKLKFQTLDLNKIFDQVIANLDVLIKEKKAKIQVKKLPFLEGDKTQLTILFQNLVQNALKYNRSPKVQILINCTKMHEEIIVNVQDNGIGIPSHQQDQIFKMFQRLHGQGEVQGTGIGLALCQKIVEKHEGRIWVESLEDDGANFRIAWPMKKVILKKKTNKTQLEKT